MDIGNPLGRLTSWITSIVETLGYIGVAVLLLMETVCPPIPSEGVLPLAGYLSNQGRLWFPGLVLASTFGSVAGALMLYTAGRALGPDKTRDLIKRFGRFVLVGEDDLDRSLRWFEEHGRAVIFFGRLIPMIRSMVSIPAGVDRMPVLTFVLYTTMGSALWNTALLGLGWFVGDQWEAVQEYVGWFGYAVVFLLLVAVIRFVIRRCSGGDERQGQREERHKQRSDARAK